MSYTIVTNDEGPALDVLGDRYRIVADAGQTDGAFAAVAVTVRPGGGVPPHIDENEAIGWLVLDGPRELLVEGETMTLDTGDWIVSPKRVRTRSGTRGPPGPGTAAHRGGCRSGHGRRPRVRSEDPRGRVTSGVTRLWTDGSRPGAENDGPQAALVSISSRGTGRPCGGRRRCPRDTPSAAQQRSSA